MEKTSRQKSAVAMLAAELIDAFGLELMQDIADQIPNRPKGNPGRPRDEEFQRICLRYLTEPGLKFDTAARRIHAEKLGGADISQAGFISVMRKRLAEAQTADPKFLQTEARRIAQEDLGEIRSDLFPAIAATQRMARETRAKFDRLTADLRALSSTPILISALSTRLAIPTLLSEQQMTEIRRHGSFLEAFEDLLPDDMPVDQIGGVYWLVRRLMEAWAKNNI